MESLGLERGTRGQLSCTHFTALGGEAAPHAGRELLTPQGCPWCGRDTGYLEPFLEDPGWFKVL